MVKRRRFKQSQTLQERLAADAMLARQKARSLPPGRERETLLRRAREDDVALHLTEWLCSPGLQAPR